MQIKVHIVEYNDNYKVVESDQLKDGCIKIRHYEDDGDSYYYESIPVNIKQTFLIKLHAQFIRNDKDNSKLNACTMSGGFGQVNRLAYSYSVIVMRYISVSQLSESDLIYANAGIKPTQFDMYSYHYNEPVQSYDETRLTYELFDSLNLYKILSNYLPKSDVRDSIIDDVLND